MLLITFDEGGNFEKQADNELKFIAGILYDDNGNPGEIENERKRILSYFRSVCTTKNAQFPVDLHFCSWQQGGNKQDNSVQVGDVKKEYKETIAEFLTKGTYRGNTLSQPDRKGKYYVFAILKSQEGKDEFLRTSISDFARDDIASNLYMHMVHDITTRLVYHNPVLSDIKEIMMDAPTRCASFDSTKDTSLDMNQINEAYGAQGYDFKKNTPNTKRLFYLTNSSNYRTALEREMIETEKLEISFDKVKAYSINYGSKFSNFATQTLSVDGGLNATQLAEMAFLYLSDAICTVLPWDIKTIRPEQGIEKFKERANDLVGHENHLIFGYDSVDTYFAKAWKKLEEKDYYEALAITYNGLKSKSKFRDYYENEWFAKLFDRLNKETDATAFKIAINKFYELAFTSNIDQEKMMHIFRHLRRMAEEGGMKSNIERNRASLYDLYDAGVRANTHIGNSKGAKEMFEKCREYASAVGLDKFTNTLNMEVVFETDSFKFDDAYQLAKENLEYQRKLYDIRSNLLEKESHTSINFGRAISQLGQNSAFCQRSLEETESIFQEALGYMENDIFNYNITLSYLLHVYIECGERSKYETMAKKYFGGNDTLETQLDYLIEEGKKGRDAIISLKYGLYVYVKALYIFYLDEIPETLLTEKLFAFKKYISQIDEQDGTANTEDSIMNMISSHPCEIIYRYMAFIMLHFNEMNKAEMYMRYARNSISKREEDNLAIQAILLHGEILYAKMLGEEDTVNALLDEMKKFFKKNYINLPNIDEYTLEMFDDVFVYMYR